ncbi:MAG: DUF6465 family protein [Lachnospiraceae bacterium]|nr:DUF6465 family protein [Lachnospiraceae bacterium]
MADTKKVTEDIKKTTAKVSEVAKTSATKASDVAKTSATKVKTAAKSTAKKASTTVKKTAAKKATKKVAPTQAVILQFAGEDFKMDDIVENAKAAFKAENKRKAIEDIKVYVKPEDKAAYYVVKSGTSEYAGKIDL